LLLALLTIIILAHKLEVLAMKSKDRSNMKTIIGLAIVSGLALVILLGFSLYEWYTPD
jgi:hypothetical protein